MSYNFYSNIKKHKQAHIVVLFLMSAVKYHAEMAVGQDTIVTARGEIRWLIYIDSLWQRQLGSEVQFGLITQIDKQLLNDKYHACTFI